MIYDITPINSTTTIVRLPKESFINEIPFIEKIAEDIGEYGNVESYEVKREGSIIKIFFKLVRNK